MPSKSTLLIFISLSIVSIALFSCNSSDSGSDDSSLSTADAALVMGQRLSEVVNEVTVEVGFPPLTTITCSNLGIYTISGIERVICQIYGESGNEGVPHFSPDGVDFVSRIPAGDADAILAAVDADLQGAIWAPILVG